MISIMSLKVNAGSVWPDVVQISTVGTIIKIFIAFLNVFFILKYENKYKNEIMIKLINLGVTIEQ